MQSLTFIDWPGESQPHQIPQFYRQALGQLGPPIPHFYPQAQGQPGLPKRFTFTDRPGASLALNPLEQLRYVILPQALRIAVAPTVGFSVQVVKGTAVTSIIGFTELTKTGGMLANATFEPFMVYGLVALGYFLLCYPLSLSARYLERRLHASA